MLKQAVTWMMQKFDAVSGSVDRVGMSDPIIIKVQHV